MLQSMGLQRVRHDLATEQHKFCTMGFSSVTSATEPLPMQETQEMQV